MKNSQKTLVLAIVFSVITVVTAYIIQLNANSSIVQCSYLDPIAVDVLAFGAAIFLRKKLEKKFIFYNYNK